MALKWDGVSVEHLFLSEIKYLQDIFVVGLLKADAYCLFALILFPQWSIWFNISYRWLLIVICIYFLILFAFIKSIYECPQHIPECYLPLISFILLFFLIYLIFIIPLIPLIPLSLLSLFSFLFHKYNWILILPLLILSSIDLILLNPNYILFSILLFNMGSQHLKRMLNLQYFLIGSLICIVRNYVGSTTKYYLLTFG